MQQPVHSPRPAASGFTLPELLIVIVIMGTLAALALPRVDYGRYRADANARTVRIALQQAQRRAVEQQQSVLVSFDLDAGRLRIVEDRNANGILDAGERVSWRGLEDGTRFDAPPKAIAGGTAAALVGETFAFASLPTVAFRRNGALSTDLEIYLVSADGRERNFRAVRVLRATGRTDLFRYAPEKANWWMTGGY